MLESRRGLGRVPRLLGAGEPHAAAAVCRSIHVHLRDSLDLLAVDLPQPDGLVVRGEQELASHCASAPPYRVDLLLDLETLQIVKLRLVALELGEKSVLSAVLVGVGCWLHVYVHIDAALLRILGASLEDDDTATAVASRKVVAGLVKVERRKQISVLYRFCHRVWGLLAEDLKEFPVAISVANSMRLRVCGCHWYRCQLRREGRKRTL
mmetsp:Transcript_21486/g.46922  ORF Transcript_21486/g.46922 Transcript_21486/m.46922 type:complete len:209 (-) Transcript_21486:397-1023(-)